MGGWVTGDSVSLALPIGTWQHVHGPGCAEQRGRPRGLSCGCLADGPQAQGLYCDWTPERDSGCQE